jgi:amidase
MVGGKVATTFRNAGAVLVGKTNLSDLGLTPEATSWVGGACRNPHDPARTAGGSSGGAACAVAAGMQAFDWGTDIGGSIRLPAAFCGVLGLRLSSACWPIVGMFPRLPEGLAWMCGQGPLASTTDELRAILEVAAPALCSGPPRPFLLAGAVLHQPDRRGQWPSFADDVMRHLRAAVDGPIEREPDLPTTTKIRKSYHALWSSHFDDLLACDESISLRDGIAAVMSAIAFRGRFGDRRFHPATAEILAAILAGRALYREREPALAEAQAIRAAFERQWDRGMVVVAPVSVHPAPLLGTALRQRDLTDPCLAANIADATALAIPFGRFGHLPRALQLMGPPGSEETLLDMADWLIASRDAEGI